MPADKLGRYMRSPEFLKRVNEAVTDAVRDLEVNGIQPAYLDRKTGRIVGGSDDALLKDRTCEGRLAPGILKNQVESDEAEE